MDRLRVGLIGLGMVSANHLRAYERIQDYEEIVAIADIRESSVNPVADRLHIDNKYLDHHELLEDDRVDAVDIMLPHNLHLQVALDAVAAGKHILIEKPLARNPSEGEKILHAARDARTKLMVANNLLFHPGVQKAHELIEKGYIGKIVLAKSRSLGWFLYNAGISKYRKSVEQTGGGSLIDTGTHFIYLLRHLVGM